VGGGTPSLLGPRDLARMMDALHGNFDCQFREVTLEADPETITREKAVQWREAGFDRVSMGAQSFSDAELRATGRKHRREQIYEAFERLRGAGFENLSLDLIAGLPYQTEESWNESLNELLAMGPEHISIYILETDEGSRLGREAIHGGARYSAREIPSDDAMAANYETACARLEQAGYEHYEISNWAKRVTQVATREGGGAAEARDLRSHHNLKYWRRAPYLGFGAGAHSFDGAMRWSNDESPEKYIAAIQKGELPVTQNEMVETRQALEEELFLGLRQLAGIDFGRIERTYGVDLHSKMVDLAERGLLEMDGSWARLAPSRLTVSNEVFVALLD
jgi:oxygen-independent coproporphyrinogen III oxidase